MGTGVNKRKLGKEKEEYAAAYLKEQGYTILKKNYWTVFSEIDMIAKEKDYLCFIEVKYRKNARYDAPEGLISRQKIQRICKASQYYMAENRVYEGTKVRYDVVIILNQEITLIRDAFSYIG